MLSSLKAAQEKLLKYYAITDSIEGNLYESNNLEKDYKRIYRESLKSFFTSYDEKRPEERKRSDTILLITIITDADLLFENSTSLRGTLKVKDYKHEFPVLTSLARDILSILEYLLYQEIVAIAEANKTRDKSFNPISDTEEEIEDLMYKAENHDEDDNDDINPPLPNI
ncbi:uncharacterized protein N7458_003686 [Penicillium daleae]|uniref:Uncharacterized protein n=1 Tax=Penicillium daleae TaxID=63821 RepID=A0AAD6CAA3_9EURO|nr:uncharacterized protein N7458_003686 [Penicillium daleae]KAJ5456103.1 hypothetical protein N7458_003686 [Penicillium daleae]